MSIKCTLLVPNLRPRFCCCWSTRKVQLAWGPSLTFHLFSPTHLKNSIIYEHSCKILYMHVNKHHFHEGRLTSLFVFIFLIKVDLILTLVMLNSFCTTFLPIFILLTYIIPVLSLIRWLQLRSADLDLQCFLKRINPGSAGQGLKWIFKFVALRTDLL